MRDFINKEANLSKIEFWGVTAIFIFTVFYLVSNAARTDVGDMEYFFPKLLKSIVLYLAFVALNFGIVPQMLNNQHATRNLFLLAGLFGVVTVLLGTLDTYLKPHIFGRYDTEQQAYNAFFVGSLVYTSWLMLTYGLYTAIKYACVYLLSNSKIIETRYQMITRDGIAVFVLWMISLFLLLVGDAHTHFVAIWIVVIPFGIGLYWYSFYALIPDSLRKKRPFLNYLGKVLLLVVLAILPIVLFSLLITANGSMGAMLSSFNFVVQLVVTAPLSWSLYKRRQRGKEEVEVLRTALGRSNANFDFLRSQINPHFLFNALNTIYGTALQENAARTSEGIERLGEMMRFMLQENMQEKIALIREIDYLNNYIALQKLRTELSPEITIEALIDQPLEPFQIAPMLFIPFVENAFKHGISLRHPSYIRISLQLKGNSVYLDVSNSVHPKSEQDPEKNKSGIGLENVKQRLRLMYPRKHDLVIRETAREFFVHLTIDLS